MCGAFLLAACKGGDKKDEAKPGATAKPSAMVAEKSADVAPGTNPYAKSAAAVIEGRKIYLKTGCSGCHGMGGGGGMGKPLIDDEWKFGSDDQTLFKLIRGEIPNQTMPNAIGKTLSDDEVWQVLMYVRSIYAGDASKINWTVPPPVSAEELAAATRQTGGDPVAAGKQIFVQVCVTCHGPEGKGDGPGAAALNPKPRNLTDASYMSGLTDRYLYELISRGGIAVGKSPLMPAQPGLVPLDLNNVVAYVKTLSGGGAPAAGAAPAAAPAQGDTAQGGGGAAGGH